MQSILTTIYLSDFCILHDICKKKSLYISISSFKTLGQLITIFFWNNKTKFTKFLKDYNWEAINSTIDPDSVGLRAIYVLQANLRIKSGLQKALWKSSKLKAMLYKNGLLQRILKTKQNTKTVDDILWCILWKQLSAELNTFWANCKYIFNCCAKAFNWWGFLQFSR